VIDKSIIEKTTSWPFVEARKLIKDRESNLKKKGKITLQTGYGPSGLPHIGTFAEVVRTTMMVNAISHLTDIPTEIITFSDDMDGLRKIPDNIPNSEILEKNLSKPLTSIPDPFKKYSSYGEHNNEMLKSFLNKFKFNYIFKSSTQLYKSGQFNDTLVLALNKYQEIIDIVIPTLGKERQKTYSPFLPLCPKTGKVLEIPVLEIIKDKNKIVFDNKGEKIEVSILDGNCKLQWKVDWAMRWYALDVDYEMYGKDLIESAVISGKICKVLGKKSPNGFPYELFLDEKGEKISKSVGNGISVDQWLRYASPESLSFFKYQKPKSAKKLFFDVIPKSVDEYSSFLNKYRKKDDVDDFNNPVWHIHNGNPPKFKSEINFNSLMNLVNICNSTDKNVIWGFVKEYDNSLNPKDNPEFDKLIQYAINYYIDFIQPNKKYIKINNENKGLFEDILGLLKTIDTELSSEEIQTQIYEIGKKHNFVNLRDYFKLVYQVLLGQEEGPRLGSFIKLYGIKKTCKLLEDALKQ